jgi:hypothetical protein
MPPSIRIGLLALLALAACGDNEKSRAPSAATVEGLGALPGEAHIVVGANVAKLAESSLARRTIRRLLAEDAALAARVEALLVACKLDPAKDVETVHVGVVEDGGDYVLVARGAFEEARLVDCVRKTLAPSNGVLEARMIANAPAYVAKDETGAERGWLAFGAPNVLLLAGSEAWMTKARDPGASKLTGQADLMGLVHRTDTGKALWAAGRLPASVARAIVDVSGGAVKGPPTGAWGHFEAGPQGLDLEANLDMASDEDATALVTFAKKQLEELAVIAQAQGLGPKVAKIQFTSAGKAVKLSLKLNASELAELEAQLDKAR